MELDLHLACGRSVKTKLVPSGVTRFTKFEVYICDHSFDPSQFFALGHRCQNICSEETKRKIHSQSKGCAADNANTSEVRCSKGHHWLRKRTIADVVEALVGAFIVDSGFKAAMAFLRWIGIQVNFEDSLVTNVCMASKNYLSLASSMDMTALENLLGYQFLHRGLLLQAFVHPSYNKHGGGCYQRLAFLGDAVVDYLITSYLFSVYPKLKPGQLTDLRSVLVNNKALANVAVDRSLHKYLLFDSRGLDEAINNYVDLMKTRSSAKGLFEGIKCPKALGDVVESCFGAILLDTGFNLENAWKIMLSFLDPIMSFSSMQLDPIRELQELCQSHDLSLQFPDSKKGATFIIEAKVTGKDEDDGIAASNQNKKYAKKMAAERLFAKLKAKGYMPKNKSLEEVLNSSEKAEARLIGCDEIPIDVSDDNGFENLKVTEPSGSNLSYSIRSDTEATSTSSPCIIPVNELRTIGGVQNRSARSRLYEICAANCWKPPEFECCEDEGPSHLKSFTFRVIVRIEAAPDIVLVCSGAPQTKKNAAAEHAAKGALWYLEQEDYLH